MTSRTEMGVRMAARATLLGGTALAVVLSLGGPARAQSDAELQAKVQALETENKIMKDQLQQMQQQIEAVAKQGPQKPVKMVESGEDDVSLKISGQVNRAVLLGGDGTRTFVNHVDNDNSSTRIRFDAKGKVDDDLTVKSRIEVELQINPSDFDNGNANQGLATHSGGAGGFTGRKAYIAFHSKTFGELTLGQESVATDGVVEMDLSGTSVVMNGEAEDFAGGITLVNEATGNAIGEQIRDGFDNFDGGGQFGDRQTGIRYESPKFLGFQLIGSHSTDGGAFAAGSGEGVDVALHYSGKIWDFKTEAGIGYSHMDDRANASGTGTGGTQESFVGGSVGVLHEPTGFNLHYAQGKVNFHHSGAFEELQPGPSFWYAKAGWKGDIWAMGSTAISIDYGEYMNDDGLAVGNSHDNFGRAYGVAIVQKIDKAATELYAGVKRYEVDMPFGDTDSQGVRVTGVEPITAALVGARIKF